MPTPTLDDQHRYWLAGRRLHGTTEPLAAAGMIDASHFTPEACERGTVVHEIAELTVTGRLLGGVDPRLRGYADACERACDDLQVEPLAVEQPMSDGISGGKPDVYGIVTFAMRRWLATIDWKSGASARWHALQTMNYQTVARSCVDASKAEHLPRLRMAVYLKADGTCAMSPHNLKDGRPDLYTDRYHQTVFNSALHVIAFRGAKDIGVPEND